MKSNSIDILSWNIQSRDGPGGSKLLDNDFLNILTKSDIFCLQECRKEIKIANYVCYNNIRKTSKGGGVCIGYSRRLMGGITKYANNGLEDVLAVSLDHSFFGLRRDVLLVCVYIPPGNSKFMKKSTEDPFESLTDLLMKVENTHDVILCGDFNSRSQKDADLFLCDSIPGIDENDDLSHDDSNYEYLQPLRNNKDSNKNNYKDAFFDLIAQGNLYIANGRSLGDIFGEYTCIHYNGASMVDYFLLNKPISSYVNYLKIGALTQFSDHKPLKLNIKSGHNTKNLAYNPSGSFDSAPAPFKWNDESAIPFISLQKNNDFCTNINTLLKSSIRDKDSVNSLNTIFTEIIINLADKCLKKPSNTNKKNAFSNKQPWFDNECRQSKRSFNAALRHLNSNPSSQTARAEYYVAKKNYTNIKKAKIRQNKSLLNQKILNFPKKQLNWSAFNKIRNSYQNRPTFDEYDIESFYHFFQKLYNSTSQLDATTKESLKDQALTKNTINQEVDCEDLRNLNRPITSNELELEIKKLNNGKSVSLDLISNEMLKYLDVPMKKLLLKLFNSCLEQSVYPWTTSTITPIPKRGDPIIQITTGL